VETSLLLGSTIWYINLLFTGVTVRFAEISWEITIVEKCFNLKLMRQMGHKLSVKQQEGDEQEVKME